MDVTDQGIPPRSAIVDVQVNVRRNENGPKFSQDFYSANVSEKITYSDLILVTTATDGDSVHQPDVSD